MSDWTSKAFGLGHQPVARDVTFKVKYGGTLKRLYTSVNDVNLDMSLSALRTKIANAFKFGPDAEFVLTYTDEDGDAVMLDDDDDLRDAVLHQKLNPLRINVQLKIRNDTECQKTNFESVKLPAQDPLSQIIPAIEALKLICKSSTAQEKCMAHIKSAVGEAIKSIPEPIPDALVKLSHEVLESTPPPVAELIKPLVQLITPNSNSNGSSAVHADGASSSMSGITQRQMPVTAKANDESKANEYLVSQHLNAHKSDLPEERGRGSVLNEAAAADMALPEPSVGASQSQQPSLYPSVEELLFPSKSVDKSVSKRRSDAQNKGKFIMSSTAKPSPPPFPTLAPPSRPPFPTLAPPPPPSISEWFQPHRRHSHRWQYEANAKDTTDSRWHIPMHNAPFEPPTLLPHASPGCGSSPHFPYPGRLLSPGHVYGDIGNKMKSAKLHKYFQCDGCGVHPILGPRYKSNVKDYDLCDSCFKRIGNETEYTKKDSLVQWLSRDPNVHRKVHPRVLMKPKWEKLESRFILDVTVLDGTLMAPSTKFTKIWRMHNNGSIMWPLGTQLIWVGGDNFAQHTSVSLEIPVNGFPVDKEIDVAVDFVAPARPGRYISYWRLASPSGQKFGQRVWVHIQVEDPSFVNSKNAINLNLPPENNSSSTPNLIDVNMEPFTNTQGYHSYPFDWSRDAFEPKKSQPAPFTFIVPSVSAEASTDSIADVPLSSVAGSADALSFSVPASEPVVPTVHLPVSMPDMTATTAATNMPVCVSNVTATTPVANMPVSVPNMTATTSVTVLASAPASTSVSAPASEHFDIDGDTEEKLLRELEEMGFKQVDLNKEILRQNKYNLEQSVDDLCGVNEWDPLLAELEEMGFDDTEMDKELLAKNGGSIKHTVMDLIAREKDN